MQFSFDTKLTGDLSTDFHKQHTLNLVKHNDSGEPRDLIKGRGKEGRSTGDLFLAH